MGFWGSNIDCGPCDCSCGYGDCCIERADICSKAVQERSLVTIEQLREEIGIPSSVTDARIERWLLAAKQAADRYLANSFCEEEIPQAVEIGLIAYVESLFVSSNGGSLDGRKIASQSVGGVSISYESRGSNGSTNAAQEAAEGWWNEYRTLVFERLGRCICGGCKC